MSATKAAAPVPRQIAKLPETVVNRIAAGEIIQRPANALKELIENALDAGATTIKVTVKEGGVKLLQIQDNGSGIRKSDLPILCERFTTSKIKAFEDLSQINTYGFRGEALASISHVAHLTVQTKTRDETCAWKAVYSDGVLIPARAGSQDTSPIPCAGNDGTLISVEDLFFNTPTRLKSLKSASDEYSRIVAVVLHYSIHNAGISMVCRKVSSSSADVNTAVGASVLDNIGLHYGESVKKELVELNVADETLGVKAHGWFSGANYGAKKGTFLFFINHRLVDCTPLKRAFEAFYASLLAKGAHPFVYLSLEIIPSKVDVNVHPTKREVGFEDEDETVELICRALAKKLEKASESRSFKVQTLLPGARPVDAAPKPSRTTSGENEPGSSGMSRSTSNTSRKVAPKSMVRTSHTTQTLDSMFRPVATTSKHTEPNASDRRSSAGAGLEDIPLAVPFPGPSVLQRATPRISIPQSETALTSVQQLRTEVIARRHDDLDVLFKNHVFVGVLGPDQPLSAVQHHQKLLLVNHVSMAEELFYQLGLRQFGRITRIKLQPPIPLREIVGYAVNHEKAKAAARIPTETIIDRICSTLIEARAMLEEYFSLDIAEDGSIEALPQLLPGFTPDLIKLPHFLVRLGVHVDWENEKRCFETFLRELGYFYAPSRLEYIGDHQNQDPDEDEERGEALASSQGASSGNRNQQQKQQQLEPWEEEEKRQIEHVVFPAARQYLVPPETLLERDVVQLTTLENLFKVFERC